ASPRVRIALLRENAPGGAILTRQANSRAGRRADARDARARGGGETGTGRAKDSPSGEQALQALYALQQLVSAQGGRPAAVAGGAEGLTGDDSDFGLLEDEVGELQGGRRCDAAPLPAEQTLHVRVDVERALRVRHDQPVDLRQLGHDHPATTVERLAHLLRF